MIVGQTSHIIQKGVWSNRKKGNNININLAVHHFLEMLGPMIQFVSVTLQCGTKINETGLESFFWKVQVVYQRACWPVALQWDPSSQLLLHAHSSKDCFLNCNISKLFEMVVLSFAMRDVVRWYLLQSYPGNLLIGRVADLISGPMGTHTQHRTHTYNSIPLFLWSSWGCRVGSDCFTPLW